jgi:hypothetical protein
MNVLDRAGSLTHGDVDAFVCEQRLIAQAKEKIGSALSTSREYYVARRGGLNKAVGDN